MKYNVDDLLLLIGELYHAKRQLVADNKVLRETIVTLQNQSKGGDVNDSDHEVSVEGETPEVPTDAAGVE